jgi:hypothetical protein
MPPRKPRLSPTERAHRAIARMSAGTAAGQIESAAPVRAFDVPKLPQTAGRGLLFHIPGSVATGIYEAYFPSYAGAIKSVRIGADGPPSGGSCVVDLLINGTSAYPSAAKPTITSGNSYSSLTVPDTKTWAANAELAIEVESANGVTGLIIEILFV